MNYKTKDSKKVKKPVDKKHLLKKILLIICLNGKRVVL